ncbi:hypothetical protein E2542_SST04754 [Spatholobus suberectus]|nr:hypothetical protein E2542_SST04754 [Spatholobus suberectus]
MHATSAPVPHPAQYAVYLRIHHLLSMIVFTDSTTVTLSSVPEMDWFACVSLLFLEMNLENIASDFGTRPQGSCPNIHHGYFSIRHKCLAEVTCVGVGVLFAVGVACIFNVIEDIW